MVEIQQQIFVHTQAINDLTNGFLQHLQDKDNQIAALVHERNNIQNQLNEQVAQCQHHQQLANHNAELSHKVNELVKEVEVLTHKLKTAVPLIDTLHNDQTLQQNHVLTSKNGHYVVKLQDDGNLVGYQGTDHSAQHAFWASNTGGVGSGPFKLVQQDDGNLVIYQGNGQPTWSSNTWHSGQAPYKFTIQDDRNIVIYDAAGHAKWASNTNI